MPSHLGLGWCENIGSPPLNTEQQSVLFPYMIDITEAVKSDLEESTDACCII